MVTIGVLFGAAFLFIYNNSTNEMSVAPPSISREIQVENEKKLKEIEEITTLLYQEGGIFEQVNNKLKELGNDFHMLLVVYSKDDIQVKYILENKEANESVQEDVKSIFFESVEKNNLDAKSFNVKVADRNDGPDW